MQLAEFLCSGRPFEEMALLRHIFLDVALTRVVSSRPHPIANSGLAVKFLRIKLKKAEGGDQRILLVSGGLIGKVLQIVWIEKICLGRLPPNLKS